MATSGNYPLLIVLENGTQEILQQLLKFGAAIDSSVMPGALRQALTKSTVKARGPPKIHL